MSLFGQHRDPALLELMRRVQNASASPSIAPRGGDLVYRKDLTLGSEPEYFFRDGSSVPRWATVRSREHVFTFPSGRTGHGDFANSIQGSSTLGILLEYNCYLTAMWLLRDSTGSLESYRLTANGTDKAQTSFNATGDTKSYNLSLAISLNVGDILSCRLLSGSTIGNTVVSIRLRRR